jgi:hypothetical protein
MPHQDFADRPPSKISSKELKSLQKYASRVRAES